MKGTFLTKDMSNGYDAVAEDFMSIRSSTGVKTVRKWMAKLPDGGSVLDVGAGAGEPITAALIEAEFNVSAIDASPNMVAAFQQRFPDVDVACEAAEDSQFFNRTFDGVLAIGLVFLLPADRQRTLITHMAEAVKPGGYLLFSAPQQVGNWDDVLTGRRSCSLGGEEYRQIIADAGLVIEGEHVDEGQSYYYDACKPLT